MDNREFWSIIIPSLMTFLLGYLTIRANKQKEQTDKQIHQIEENTNMLQHVLDDVEDVKHVVDEHTESINQIATQTDLLGRESVETLRRLLGIDYRKYKEQGWWTVAEKAQWNINFTTYTELGGNHEVPIYNEELMQLPVREG